MKRDVLILILCVSFCFISGSVEAATFNVNNVVDLQNALTSAQNNGEDDIIDIAAGTYSVTTPLTYFTQENHSLSVIGTDASTTILDGGGAVQIIVMDTFGAGSFDDNCHIVLKNVTLQSGLASSGLGEGGGLRIETARANITIENSKFINNSAKSGGGVYAKTYLGIITVTGNFFINNSVSGGQGGGGIYAYGQSNISKNMFTNNASNGGGGVYAYVGLGLVQTTISENIFSNNNATTGLSGSFWGGGFFGLGPATLINNRFTNNNAYVGGGVAVQPYYPSQTITLINNVFIKNEGGGVFLSSSGFEGSVFNLTNNTIYGNTAAGIGLGITVSLNPNDAMANLYNNIIWGNNAGAGTDLSIYDDENNDGTGAIVKLYNNDINTIAVQDGDHLFQGSNVNNDPLFLDISDPSPENWNLRIHSGSSCVDAGDNTAPSLQITDMDGTPRIFDGNNDGLSVVDIGAFEAAPNISAGPDHDFGDVKVGSISVGQTFTISNVGSLALVVKSITLTNAESTIDVASGGSNPCSSIFPFMLPANTSCTLTGTFSPGKAGAQNSTLRIYSNDPDSPLVSIALSGTGILDTYTKVTLLGPNGHEIVPAGSNYEIRWGESFGATKFKLKYSMDNGATWKSIAVDLTGNSYVWQVPQPLGNKRKCFVKVIGYDDNNVKVGADTSDAPFTVEVLKLTSPNGMELLTSGQQYNITWKTNATAVPVVYVDLSYTLNNGLTWKTIDTTADLSNDGNFLWIVPNSTKVKTKCKLKVAIKDASGNKLGSDASDAVFTIKPTP